MCDTWVALRDATRVGNVILGKNSDRPIFDSQPLSLHPRRTWPAGSTVQTEYVELSQAPVTYATLGSGPYWCWGYEEGINEYGVAIGNEAIFTKPLREAVHAHRQGNGPQPGLLGMDLVRLALERSRAAAQAVALMGELTERYGQFGSAVPAQSHATGGYDNSFLIADPTEAWIFETAGRHWAARRIIQGHTSISNEPTIRTAGDAGSAGLVEYAVRQRWWPASRQEDFDFARAYSDENVSRQVSHMRVQRSRQLLAEREGGITPRWMARIARDHYEGTFLEDPYFDAADPDFLTICMHVSPAGFTWGNTASSCVAVLPRTEDEFPVFWWTPGPPCNGCYVPFFVHGRRLPPVVSRAGTAGKAVVPPPQAQEDGYSPDSYWWLFRRLLDRAKGDPIRSVPGLFPERNRLVREWFDSLEEQMEEELPEVLAEAAAARSSGQTAVAQILDSFTDRGVKRVVTVLHELLATFDNENSSFT